MSKAEWEKLIVKRDPELIEARRKRLTLFTNSLLMASARLLGEKEFNQWTGDVAVDGTPIKAANNGTRRKSKRVSSEPDAGWYVREGDHKGSEDSDPSKLMWAYEATLATMTFPATDDEMPSLIVGIALDKPGCNIAERAVDALTHIINDDTLPKGHFIGDRAYLPGSKAEKLAMPLRRAGYKMMGDQSVRSVGKQATHEGAVLVDGTWYIDCMPEALVNAGVDFVRGDIDETQFASLIEARKPYQLKIKTTKPTGDVVYYNPANYGQYTTLEVPGLDIPIQAGRGLIKVGRGDLPRRPLRKGLLKGNKTVSIPFATGAKFAQQGPAWGTQEWATLYFRGRNTIESRNDLLKSGRYSSIGDQTTRMVRGFTANALFVALGAVSVNVGLIRRYLHRLVVNFGAKPTPPTPPETRISQEFLEDRKRANAPPREAA